MFVLGIACWAYRKILLESALCKAVMPGWVAANRAFVLFLELQSSLSRSNFVPYCIPIGCHIRFLPFIHRSSNSLALRQLFHLQQIFNGTGRQAWGKFLYQQGNNTTQKRPEQKGYTICSQNNPWRIKQVRNYFEWRGCKLQLAPFQMSYAVQRLMSLDPAYTHFKPKLSSAG